MSPRTAKACANAARIAGKSGTGELGMYGAMVEEYAALEAELSALSARPRMSESGEMYLGQLDAEERIRQLTEQNAALKLLKDMDAITASAIGTFILGGDIPETLDRAKAVLVTRMLKAEAEAKRMRPVFDAAIDWSGAEPSTSVLCRAIDEATK